MKVTSFSCPSPPPSPCSSSNHHANVYRLPFELWLHILSFVSPTDLHHVRQLCRMFQCVCDQPQLWKHLNIGHNYQTYYWRVHHIKAIVTPHTIRFIQSIHIEHASDAIIHFLIQACPLLQDLTVYGWHTLSHHALKHLHRHHHHPMMRRFRLIGHNINEEKGPLNFAAIGTNALARFITSCPQLQEFDLVAKAPIHLPSLCRALVGTGVTSTALESLTLTTAALHGVSPSSDWREQLLQACPKLLQVKLMPVHGNNGSLPPLTILMNK
ncbi:hypothetical protein O0I10_002666 [Lichtheimia ornata]|uniref:F-box domain-containing protein n=1 Tax=Lichtheimia ornata TaxID=688661 RepID=A0AAD7Y0F0_9FUNG|nr:uncharacterized protein O0I10_002666 [Lichtheimia ornata]KAJ8661400.1 hypothetical protein O0I10_002666 [Lichtheimia ornata]